MENKVAVIMGTGPGLGMALANRFARADFRVIAACRAPEKLSFNRSAEEVRNVEFVSCDASNEREVTALFERVAADFAAPGIVIFNAGAYEPGHVLEIDPQDFERCWRVGCLAGFLVGRAAARLMVAAGAGTIIFTGASASLRGSAGFANLAVAKFGLRALAQSMARELGPRGIHVAHVVIDGQIESERYKDLLEKRGRNSLLAPEAIAEEYFRTHRQHNSAWTHEMDLRPWVERF
jgi:NAD(P)-dependent dehydrogenase (short-subunit alcohol dehydrogenase family)